MKMTGVPVDRAAAMSRCKFGIIAIAEVVGCPALPSAPSARQKSFCTSTTTTALFAGRTSSGSVFIVALLRGGRDGMRRSPGVDDLLRRRAVAGVFLMRGLG